jgi:hypothetical protein
MRGGGRVDIEFSGRRRKTALLNDFDKDLQMLGIHIDGPR